MSRYFAMLVIFIYMGYPGAALAQCHLDGKTYEEGDVVAGYVCDEGEWLEL